MMHPARRYWDETAREYFDSIRISTADFHYGPLLPGESALRLLPRPLRGKRCLELGCGGGQNSRYLADQGAVAFALDLAGEMMGAGGQRGAPLSWVQADMERLPFRRNAWFDLIHSVYGLPFVENPQRVIREAAVLLRPGGSLLLSVAHPVFSGEWIDLEGAGLGVFLESYFEPRPDRRTCEGGPGATACRAWPLSRVFEWLRGAGLVVERFLEPRPAPIPAMTEAEIVRTVPYESPLWREHYEELRRAPPVAIFLARRPN